jgi:hypothetical protein
VRQQQLLQIRAETTSRRAQLRAERARLRTEMALRRLLISSSSQRAAAAILEAAVEVAGFGAEELWLEYFALGGDASPSELAAMLSGRAPLHHLDHDRVAVVLNERLHQAGLGQPLAYWDGSR